MLVSDGRCELRLEAKEKGRGSGGGRARDCAGWEAGGFMLRVLEGIFARGNEVKSLLAALGVVLVALGSLLGCSWPFLVVLGAVLDRSSAVLGRLEAVLERSWAVLGKSLGHLGAVLGRFLGG